MESQRRKPIRFWFVVIALVILIFVFGYSTVRNSFFKPFEFISIPFVKISYAIGSWIHSVPEPLKDKLTLVSENDRLKEENERLLQENSLLRSLQEEAFVTKRMQEFLDSIQSRGVTAHVIGKSGTEEKSIIIDKGLDDGISNGLAVITENGVLIGTITDTQSRISHVLLITDSSQHIAAKIQNELSSPGVIKGEFGLALIMQLIPQNDNVQSKQTVVTSALDKNIPPNLLIGTITEVNKKEGSVFQDAKVVSPIQIERVETVSVIIAAHEEL